jgi:aspartate carbamoyltransferase catalytic subunit
MSTPAPVTGLRGRHLLGISDLAPDEITLILDTADAMREVGERPIKKVPALRGRTIVNLFFEPSTRTRTSFEIAEKRLSADTLNLAVSTSSVVKGETLLDTVSNIEAMAPDMLVVRHASSGACHQLARHCRSRIVNAGDGLHEHPTQALLDAFTIRRKLGKLEGLKIAICGDIAHSRVARSNALLLTMFGNEVRFAGPRTLLPPFAEQYGVKVFDRIEPALEGVDVVMMLRIQKERLEGSALVPSMREYSRAFGLNPKRLALAAPDAIVMHPGPMNRGVEIDPSIADGERSLVLDQVEAGVAVRMAVLYMLAAEGGNNSSVLRLAKEG